MRRDTDSVADIVIAARRAIRYVGSMSRAELQDDELTSSAVVMQTAIIGEATTRLSDEFRSAHPAGPGARSWEPAISSSTRTTALILLKSGGSL